MFLSVNRSHAVITHAGQIKGQTTYQVGGCPHQVECLSPLYLVGAHCHWQLVEALVVVLVVVALFVFAFLTLAFVLVLLLHQWAEHIAQCHQQLMMILW